MSPEDRIGPAGTGATRPPARGWVLLAGGVLALLVLGLFWPAIRGGFGCLDDQAYVTANAHVQNGLTWEGVRWAFSSFEIANWHPVTWLSHMADCTLFGLRPAGHHLTSVLLHALNTLLVFLVLRSLTGATWRSLFVAALFGLHPLRVESVAWIAERKDVLSTFFLLLTLWAYAAWAQRVATRRSWAGLCYGLALAAFALGLMSKPMLVTVPFVLLLLDYWPLQRIPRASAGAAVPVVGRLMVEKIPFFLLAAASGVVTFLAQKSGGAVQTMTRYPWEIRVENALVSYVRYLGKFVWPVDLAIFYPHPGAWAAGQVALAGALLAAISVIVVVGRRPRPYLLVGWLWYVGMLVPVIGLVQVGVQSMADRYTYVPLLGVGIALTWGTEELTRSWRHRGIALGVAAGAVLAGCVVLTHRQIGWWADAETLFRHALDVTENNAVAQNGLGTALVDRPERRAEAIAHFREALRIEPGFANVHFNLGKALADTPGQMREAIAECEVALRLRPRWAEAHNNLGKALASFPGREVEALAQVDAALRIDPDLPEAHNNRGNLLLQFPDRLAEAIAEYDAAIRLKPAYAEAHNNRGFALAQIPARLPEAVAAYRTAVRLKPGYADAHVNLGNALTRLPGRMPEAITEYEAALRYQPDYLGAHYNLAVVLAALPDRLPEAIGHLEAVLRLRPGDPAASQALARLRAAQRAR